VPRCGDYTLLQYQNADTTKFCNEKADITNFIMKKGETMNFGSAKKRTLQSFVMKKADTTKFKGDNNKLFYLCKRPLQARQERVPFCNGKSVYSILHD
jgi:hypothetical protein